jgi:hypothetical protein
MWADVYEDAGGEQRHRHVFSTVSRRLRATGEGEGIHAELQAERRAFLQQLNYAYRAAVLGALRADGFSRVDGYMVQRYLNDRPYLERDFRVEVMEGHPDPMTSIPAVEVRLYCAPLESRPPWCIRQPCVSDQDYARMRHDDRPYATDRSGRRRDRRRDEGDDIYRELTDRDRRRREAEEMHRLQQMGVLDPVQVRSALFGPDTPSSDLADALTYSMQAVMPDTANLTNASTRTGTADPMLNASAAELTRTIDAMQQRIAAAAGLPGRLVSDPLTRIPTNQLPNEAVVPLRMCLSDGVERDVWVTTHDGCVYDTEANARHATNRHYAERGMRPPQSLQQRERAERAQERERRRDGWASALMGVDRSSQPRPIDRGQSRPSWTHLPLLDDPVRPAGEDRNYRRETLGQQIDPRREVMREIRSNGRVRYHIGDGRYWDDYEPAYQALRQVYPNAERDQRQPIPPRPDDTKKRTVAELARKLGITGDKLRGHKADRIIIDDPHVEPKVTKQCHTCTKLYETNHADWWLANGDEKWHIPDDVCFECAARPILGIQGLRQVLRTVGDALAFALAASLSLRTEAIIRVKNNGFLAHREPTYERVQCTRHGFSLGTQYSRVLTELERSTRTDGAQVITWVRCGPCKEHEENCKHAVENVLPRLMIACAAMHWEHGVDSMTKRFVLVAYEREERPEEQSVNLKRELIAKLDAETPRPQIEIDDVDLLSGPGKSLCDQPEPPSTIDPANGVNNLLLELD